MSIGRDMRRSKKANRKCFTDTRRLGRLFYSLIAGFQKVLKTGILKIDKDIHVVTKRVEIPFCYMLFPGRRCPSGLAIFHLLIREQFFYGQFSSPCKSLHLNFEYRYLQFLISRFTPHKYFSHICIMKSNEKGDEPA